MHARHVPASFKVYTAVPGRGQNERSLPVALDAGQIDCSLVQLWGEGPGGS